MKKFLFFAMAMVATCILFNSCESGVQSQAIVAWGFESTEKPGTIDGNPFWGVTFAEVQKAVEEEVKNSANWEITDDLGSGGQIARKSSTTEANTKKELTDIFEIAIKKAEDSMKEKGYVFQPDTKENVLAIYKFIQSEPKETTLRFAIPVYFEAK